VGSFHTHTVIDFVLSSLGPRRRGGKGGRREDDDDDDDDDGGDGGDGDDDARAAAMKELLLDSVQSMDALAGAGALAREHSQPLLSMMRVLVRRATPAAGRDGSGRGKGPNSNSSSSSSSDGGGDNNDDDGDGSKQQGQWQQWYIAHSLRSLRAFRTAVDTLMEREILTEEEDEEEEEEEEEEEGVALLSTADRRLLSQARAQARKIRKKEEEDSTTPQVQEQQRGLGFGPDTAPAEKGSANGDNAEEGGCVQGLPLVTTVLRRCCYYLTLPRLVDQVLVLSVMTDCVARLASNRTVLLPAVHKMWPSLVSKLREMRIALAEVDRERRAMAGQTRLMLAQDPSATRVAAYALPALLSLLTVMATTTGDFLSVKFKDELWPELFALLVYVNPEGSSSSRSSSSSEGKCNRQQQQQQQPGGNYNPQYPHPGSNNNPQQQQQSRPKEMLDFSLSSGNGGSDGGMRSVSRLLGSATAYNDADANANGDGDGDTSGDYSMTSPSSSIRGGVIITPNTPIRGVTITPSSSQKEHKHSLDAKIKLALLRCVESVVSLPACYSFVCKEVGRCCIRTMPMLCGLSQADEVVGAAVTLMQSLLTLDAPLVGSLLQAMADPNPNPNPNPNLVVGNHHLTATSTTAVAYGKAAREVLGADPRTGGLSSTDMEQLHELLVEDPTFVKHATALLLGGSGSGGYNYPPNGGSGSNRHHNSTVVGPPPLARAKLDRSFAEVLMHHQRL
jgi:hypothetical protein